MVLVPGCIDLPAPTNGFVSGTGTNTGDTRTFTCGSSYQLVGSALRACQADGTWDGTDVQCVGKF